ncbi:hypothetical protein K2173_010150 (mitochondrion) [Erythroxylum novogranatense]|uniref:Uncharacterized protein n=1 Tax=Erythroxylum novogranatense TaxID=1862640 RepID=A0AAV8S403_9ROSI|nr:hypothetical protein K2173_010150 [Erythroxylum novogranatense]
MAGTGLLGLLPLDPLLLVILLAVMYDIGCRYCHAWGHMFKDYAKKKQADLRRQQSASAAAATPTYGNRPETVTRRIISPAPGFKEEKKNQDLASREMLDFRKERSQAYAESGLALVLPRGAVDEAFSVHDSGDIESALWL